MQDEIGIDKAAMGIISILNQERGHFDAALLQAGSSSGLKNIYGYYHENIGNEDYPFLMVQELREGLTWIGLPNIAENSFDFAIYGQVWHDDPQVSVNMRRALAAELKKRVNRRHLGITLPDGTEIEFSGANPPIVSVDFTDFVNSNRLIRGFTARLTTFVHPFIRDDCGVVR